MRKYAAVHKQTHALRVRPFEQRDWNAWRRMSMELFPEQTATEAEASMRDFLARDNGAVFVAEREDGSVCGYVEVAARPYADGCVTSPVGYIEEWYVDVDVRRRGYGLALLTVAEAWAKARGYREMASDTQLGNEVSRQAHEHSGYAEVDRIIQFRKPLT